MAKHSHVPLPPLLKGFPPGTPQPKYLLGSQVCWHPLPSSDWGTIIGLQVAPTPHAEIWGWRYLVLLDPNSPSAAWAEHDWAWEEDLLLQSSPLEISPVGTTAQEQQP